jgi:hypothetical protein
VVGYIKLHRKVVDWQWYSDIVTRGVFMDLLVMATYRPMEVRGTHLDAGQCITSYPSIAHRNGISERQARTALAHLKSTGEVTVRTTGKFSVVTLANWAFYQSDEDEATGRATGSASTRSQANDRLEVSIQEDKKKRRKEHKDPAADREAPVVSPMLDQALQAFREMRVASKRKLTPRAEGMILHKLEELAPGDETMQARILDQSTMNGWLGVFPLKGESAETEDQLTMTFMNGGAE